MLNEKNSIMKVVRAICYLHKLWVLGYQVAHAQQISMLNLWVRQCQMRIVIDDNTLCKPPLTHFYRHELHQIWKVLDSQARLVTSCIIFPSVTGLLSSLSHFKSQALIGKSLSIGINEENNICMSPGSK